MTDRDAQLAQNYASYGINPTRGFLVAGESNGADIALAIAHLYAEEALGPPLTGLYLAAPQAMNREAIPEKYRDHFISLEQNADCPTLSDKSLEFIRCK